MRDVSSLIGIPYKEHGRTLDGFDCYGFLLYVEKEAGNVLPDFDYSTYDNKYITNCFDMVKDHVSKIDDFVDDAIVLFHDANGYKSHVGVYVGDGYIAHCDWAGVHLDKVSKFDGKIAGVYVWQN